MRVTLLCVGKTDEKYIEEGIAKYTKRLIHYVKFNITVIPDIKNSKNLSQDQQKEKEADLILKQVDNSDTLMLLDEKGQQYRSVDFSKLLDKNMVSNVQHMVVVIGGPYGFSDRVYQRANGLLSLSKMTFSHQMIRLFFVEQLYRAFSIMRGEPYHHE
ncbi:23S rRNA (pseudouridine(1915)-N(3))-methyltransferase RlmH [Sphingobacterium corticibacter]|uniref:Ribosomal RNA large subunit methyltransferase H n=1 Tax=Sphingobacterium corticibacter TaxID=2171749 RepID=A0A2T8HLX0_9SPHI|nr:23S rRNA (pseudouridine(1915)-N(3))-methyltransferase RlmH [Sphingobacterium corticibacter]PVH26429.1 23S rRNA (pseudouridine(1915)-N(3))-methyltransferase RlmH [Sphingobacterium corticibacter]